VRQHHREEKVELAPGGVPWTPWKRRLGEKFNKAWRYARRKEQEKEQGQSKQCPCIPECADRLKFERVISKRRL
jgi:hypothetical protein